MKPLLIKLGKVFNAIRQDGLFTGGRRTLAYLGVYLRTIFSQKSGDILIITGGVGDSARFRSLNVAEELNLHGLKTATTIFDDPRLLGYADKFKIFIFHKPVWVPKIKNFVEKIKSRKREIIFDADDLLFDPKYQKSIDYLKNTNAFEKKAYNTGLGREILTDPYVKVCTTTTSFLADILKNHGKKVFVVPNKLSNNDIKIAEKLSGGSASGNVRIGYFSGSSGHNKDFATVADALAGIMKKYPTVRLFFAGPLDIGNNLEQFRDRVTHLRFVSREKHFKNIADVDINIVPLEIGNPFCESKSELKFFEAGILGIPTIAARNQTFSEAISEGENGFLAGIDSEWTEKLEKLIMNKELRAMMGEKAREKTLKDYTNKNSNNEEYYNYLKSKL